MHRNKWNVIVQFLFFSLIRSACSLYCSLNFLLLLLLFVCFRLDTVYIMHFYTILTHVLTMNITCLCAILETTTFSLLCLCVWFAKYWQWWLPFNFEFSICVGVSSNKAIKSKSISQWMIVPVSVYMAQRQFTTQFSDKNLYVSIKLHFLIISFIFRAWPLLVSLPLPKIYSRALLRQNVE